MLQTLPIVLCGIFWLIAYFLIIRRALLDKKIGIPVIAVALNYSWELNYALILSPFLLYSDHNAALLRFSVFFSWAFIDTLIVWLYLKYGAVNQIAFNSVKSRIAFFIIAMAVALPGIIITELEFNTRGAYAAFFTNFIMSILFCLQVLETKSLAGQSIYIAIFKWLGSLTAAIFYLAIYSEGRVTAFFIYMYIIIFLFDVAYIYLVYKQCQSEKINPWKRF